MKIVAFSGPSNSGKTTLIVKLVELLKASFKITVIKHDPKDKAVFDTKGKDSAKFFDSGANVIVTSPKRTTYFSNEQSSMKKLLDIAEGSDLVFIEGLKHIQAPRIGVFRDSIQESYLPFLDAVAIKDIPKDEYKKLNDFNLEILNLDDIDEIIAFIDKIKLFGYSF